MKLFAENKGWITLEPRHQMAAGGEGSIYALADAAFKIYHDRRDLSDKIRLLQQIDHPGVVAPKGVLKDGDGRFAGYWMKRQSGEALPNLFANAWRRDHGFGNAESAATAEAMREVVAFAHSRGALLVDANEFNWIVTISSSRVGGIAKTIRPMALDVDSWQIERHKATAIMPSIRDWSAQGFSEHTDWFTWAVVTFQIFTGIHPYKGTHPDFGKGDLEARMRANASVFDPGVRLNSAVRDIQAIPQGLLGWYRAVFQDGVRGAPPTQFGAASMPSSRTVIVASGDAQVSVTRLHHGRPPQPRVPLAASRVAHDRMVWLGGRLFAVVNDSDRGLVEFDENGFVKAQWPVIANATTFFRTGALSWYLGQPYLLAVDDTVGIYSAPFLKTAGKIIDVFTHNGRFAIVLSVDKTTGTTFRRIARFNGQIWQEEACEQTEESFINAAGTGTGVVAHIPQSGELRVYAARSPKSAVIRSKTIKAEMILETFEDSIVFFEGGEAYRLGLTQTAT